MKMRVSKWLIHAIAECKDCDWRCEDYLNAQRLTREHAAKTGHTVAIDLGYAAEYSNAEKVEVEWWVGLVYLKQLRKHEKSINASFAERRFMLAKNTSGDSAITMAMGFRRGCTSSAKR